MGCSSRANTPVAILGMACRLPGAADLRALWELVRRGASAWGPVPADRFDAELLFDPERGVRGKSYTRLGGLVDYPPVDRRLCPLPDTTIASYDRAHLALCEIAAAACRDARLDPAHLPLRNTGVYVGHTRASGLAGEMMYAMYVAQTAHYLREVATFDRLAEGLPDALVAEIVEAVRRSCPERRFDGGPFVSPHFAAALIAKTFGLSGPQMVFNAACASSSQAMVQAVRALQLGRIDMAIVGGASHFHSDTLVTFSQAQSVSNSGSRPFDAEADGLIVAEGYVAVILKTLDRALADKDRIRAVITGVGISSDGRGKSLWAPRKEGQIEAIRRAYRAEVGIDRLQYIEAHATSTQVGDATEAQALAAVLEGQIPPGRKIPVGSVKANLGHTLEAAGLAGVAKTVLAMEQGVIPPLANCRRLNAQIDWDASPLFVPLEEMAWERWPDGAPRRACVNAFGIGGLNVHLVLDEFLPAAPAAVQACELPGAAAAAPASPCRDEPVAIIGMGVVLPGALSLAAYWDMLVSGRDPKGDVPPDRWNADIFCRPGVVRPWCTPTKLGGFVRDFQYDWRKHTIPPKQIAQASPLHFMVLQAVDEAFERAGLDVGRMDRRRVGVVVGTTFGGDFAMQMVMGLHLPRFRQTLAQALRGRGVPEAEIERIGREYEEVFFKHMPALLDETGSFTSSALASRITKVFDLMGGGVALDAGMASSLAALDCCVDLLAGGSCDVMVCVGAQQDMVVTKFEAWSLCGLLAPGAPRAPFDAGADGSVPGEGCGVLLLKRLADAERDGNPVYGVVRGVGAGSGSSRAHAAWLAASRALERSGAAPKDVVLVETPGMSRPELDAQEAQAMAAVYGGQGRARPVLLGTVTGQIGHTGAASGMAGLIKAVLALQQEHVPASMGLAQPSPLVAEYPSAVELAVQPGPLARQTADRQPMAGVSCGGNEVFCHALIERGAHVSLPFHVPSASDGQAARLAAQPVTQGEIVHFDATARRRERMRSRGELAAETTPAAAAQPAGSSAPLAGPSVAQAPQAAPLGIASAASPATRPRTAALAPHTPAAPAVPAPPPRVAPQPSTVVSRVTAAAVQSPRPGELEGFLVNFVVEQTGYPPEVVELDADLEADLGIDSIKKAQLLGELREYFPFEPSSAGNITLDDFPTLRHVLEFLQRIGARADEGQGVTAASHAEVVAGPMSATGSPPATGAPPAPVAPAAVAPAALAAPAPTPAKGIPAMPLEDLEGFLVRFVVEQTGYPPEIVELDADLEADLGIDSIKKAQLFGELREYFPIQPSGNLTLDDFPTLRQILNFLQEALGGASASPGQAALPAPAPPAPQATAAPAASSGAGSAPRVAPPSDAIESLLVNYVVERTGCPAEAVDLDSDLEADLGVDPMAKAQMVAELREELACGDREPLPAEEMVTLRQVRDYLAGRAGVRVKQP